MSGSGNTSAGNVLGVSTTASAATVLANTGVASSWITITASIALGLSIIAITLKIATSKQ